MMKVFRQMGYIALILFTIAFISSIVYTMKFVNTVYVTQVQNGSIYIVNSMNKPVTISSVKLRMYYEGQTPVEIPVLTNNIKIEPNRHIEIPKNEIISILDESNIPPTMYKSEFIVVTKDGELIVSSVSL